jgi:hypothetical protein
LKVFEWPLKAESRAVQSIERASIQSHGQEDVGKEFGIKQAAVQCWSRLAAPTANGRCGRIVRIGLPAGSEVAQPFGWLLSGIIKRRQMSGLKCCIRQLLSDQAWTSMHHAIMRSRQPADRVRSDETSQKSELAWRTMLRR